MLYRAGAPLADQKALEAALVSGVVQTLVVNTAAEQSKAKGWTDDLASLIAKPESASDLS